MTQRHRLPVHSMSEVSMEHFSINHEHLSRSLTPTNKDPGPSDLSAYRPNSEMLTLVFVIGFLFMAIFTVFILRKISKIRAEKTRDVFGRCQQTIGLTDEFLLSAVNKDQPAQCTCVSGNDVTSRNPINGGANDSLLLCGSEHAKTR